MAFTAAFKAALLDPQFNAGTVYVSLHTGDPSTTGANELSGNGYVRQLMEFNAAGADGITENTNIETFGPATPSGWAEVTYFGLWSAETVGTFRGGFQLTTPQTVAAGNSAKFAAGALTVSI
jgi:hypothetical protein